jgi:hypothetical protein
MDNEKELSARNRAIAEDGFQLLDRDERCAINNE